MATLPAIDANDEPKSLAAFRFYCCVLGSLGQLPVRPRCILLCSSGPPSPSSAIRLTAKLRPTPA